jgi:hypothetical protein
MSSSLDFSHLPPPLQAIPRVNGRLPPNTPIEALGLTKEGTGLLTRAAARLSKADLEDLGRDPAGAQARLGLTVNDLNSISAAFSEPLQIGHGLAKGFSACCTCTPCCTCAAAMPIAQTVR